MSLDDCKAEKRLPAQRYVREHFYNLTPGGQALNWEMTENRDSSGCELR